MRIALNFESIVSIGSFNPSILSPAFLGENKIFESELTAVGRGTPVVAELRFGDIQFLMELDKFQIVENDVASFSRPDLIDIMLKYLEILKYTPLSAIGINLNFNIYDINMIKFNQHFLTASGVVDFLKKDIKEVSIQQKMVEKEFGCKSLSTVFFIKDVIKNSMKITTNFDHIVINNNFEVGNLREDRNKINIIKSEYDSIISENDELIKIMEDLQK